MGVINGLSTWSTWIRDAPSMFFLKLFLVQRYLAGESCDSIILREVVLIICTQLCCSLRFFPVYSPRF